MNKINLLLLSLCSFGLSAQIELMFSSLSSHTLWCITKEDIIEIIKFLIELIN